MSIDKPNGFLSRWSRLKRAPEPVEPLEAENLVSHELVVDPLATPPTEDIDDALVASLPRLEDLTAQTDLSAFMRSGVPDGLKQAAIRRMWSLDPAIADFIEMADYQWDFNTSGSMHGFGAMDTSVDVAKMLRRIMGDVLPEEADEQVRLASEHARSMEPGPAEAESTEIAAHGSALRITVEPLPAPSIPDESLKAWSGPRDPDRDDALPAETIDKTLEFRIAPARRRHGGAAPA